MSTTRREFLKDVAVGTARLAVADSLSPWAAAAATKYGHYVHNLVYRKGKGGPGCADYITRMNGKDLNGRETNFAFGYYSKVGAWDTSDTGGHTHPFNECLVFAGLEPKDPNYLGAEIEISLGKEYEKYVIDVPSIVCVPANLPHGPIVTKKVEKPFAHYSIGLAADYKATKLPAKPAATSSQNTYAHLIKKMSATGMPGQTKIGPGNADWLSWPKSKDLEGFIVNFTWGFYNGLGPWHPPGFDPHVHIGDEFLVYVGLDQGKPQNLQASVDQYMGEDARTGKQQEVFVIDTPSVVVCPAGFPHAPAVTKRVDKTYTFFLIRRDVGQRPAGSPNKTPGGYPIM